MKKSTLRTFESADGELNSILVNLHVCAVDDDVDDDDKSNGNETHLKSSSCFSLSASNSSSILVLEQNSEVDRKINRTVEVSRR